MRAHYYRRIRSSVVAGLLLTVCAGAQDPAPPEAFAAANLTLPAPTSPVPAAALLNPEASEWARFPVRRLALNRTPPLYDTDPPAGLEIPLVDVRVARAEGKLLVHLSWTDRTQDVAALPAVPDSPPEQRDRKELSPATERFFDAAAVMFPSAPTGVASAPSLQMGDPHSPVTIYYWNAARGPLLMAAHGRSTTRRTGESFTAQGVYRGGVWRLALELPELPAGVPLAFAVWNGSQMDRDGRKYFSVWHWLE